MGELSQDALSEEFKRGFEGEDQKVSNRLKLRLVVDCDA